MISPYLQGPYAPVDTELEVELTLRGALPPGLSGHYIRNGPNPAFTPPGRYHWFDGDGMLHGVMFEDGRAVYRNRWVPTAALEIERAEGQAVFGGVMEPVKRMAPGGPYKDTANTDVVAFGGELWALWYVSGQPQRFAIDSLTPKGPAPLPAGLKLAAHPKVDPTSQQLHFFSYGFKAPFLSYGVLDREGSLLRSVELDVPGPRLPHDMALTPKHAVLMDLPLYFDPKALAAGRWVTRFHPDEASRFALIDRESQAVRWFEDEPGYIYHTVNAYEDGNCTVMHAFWVPDPLPPMRPEDGEWARMMANLRVTAHLKEWRFNHRTGETKTRQLDDLNAEFPTVDDSQLGLQMNNAYAVTLGDTPTLTFDGLVRYELSTGASDRYRFPAGVLGSEAPFAPKQGGAPGEGYLLSFVQDTNRNTSSLWIFDAADLASGPLTQLDLPQRVPLGFHATWVPKTASARNHP